MKYQVHRIKFIDQRSVYRQYYRRAVMPIRLFMSINVVYFLKVAPSLCDSVLWHTHL